ncbi:MAG: hypothetical protein IH899_22155, partial [Planctomycetes bacterium]|nr:hypothetical protein [Planctomycetota bacterium]
FVLEDNGEQFTYDPLLGWKNSPNSTVSESDFQITINSHGLRGGEVSYAKAKETRRILILGDSFAFGFDVSDDETFSVALQELLNGRPLSYEVLNAGVCGYGTDQAYLNLLREGFRYSPDVVVLAFFIENDFEDNLKATVDVNSKPYFVDGSLTPRNVPVPVYSPSAGSGAFVRPNRLIFSSALYRLLFFASVSNGATTSPLEMLGLVDVEAGLQSEFRGNLIDLAVAITSGMADACDERDTAFVVMKFGGFLGRSFQQAGPWFERKLRLARPQIEYLDLDLAFEERGLSAEVLTEGAGGYHWNAAGHHHVAEVLSEFLQNRGLLE